MTYDLIGGQDSDGHLNPPQQSGIEMVDTSAMSSTSPPPPKPIRIGTGTLELSALTGIGGLGDSDPVYSEVVDVSN